MILIVTHIDSKTGVSCAQAPCRNGPKLPQIDNLVTLWSRTSINPTNVPEIVCRVPPGDYLSISGVLATMPEEDEPAAYAAELAARETQAFESVAAPIRKTRNSLLAESDIYVIVDYPVSTTKLVEWKAYRQLLRDVTTQPGFPHDVVWPEPPTKE